MLAIPTQSFLMYVVDQDSPVIVKNIFVTDDAGDVDTEVTGVEITPQVAATLPPKRLIQQIGSTKRDYPMVGAGLMANSSTTPIALKTPMSAMAA